MQWWQKKNKSESLTGSGFGPFGCKRKPHPSSFDQLSSEFFGGVVECELLTAQVVDWRVALQVQEKVVVETHLLRLLLAQT